MDSAFIDTDVLMRYLTGDDPAKQARAATLLGQVERGNLQLIAPVTAIADCVYLLSSPRLYNKPPTEVADLLRPILKLTHFKVQKRQTIMRALDFFVTHNIGFGDAFAAASMLEEGVPVIYSFDAHFERVKGITRKEP